MYRCKKCGGVNVHHAQWVNLNTEEVGEVFGSWCHGDNNYCDDCGDHTQIEWEDDEGDRNDRPNGAVSQDAAS